MGSELTLLRVGGGAPAPRVGRARTARATASQASPMTAAQRAALRELVHGSPTLRASRWARPARAGDAVWAAVLALLLAACVVSPLEDLGYVPAKASATATAAERPHVDERVAHAPAPGAGVIR